MPTLQISYDLNQPGREYGPLIERIKYLSGGNWCHAMESHWLIKTNLAPVQVRNDLLGFIDHSSKLLVMDVSGDAAAWHGLTDAVSAWLKANL